LKAESDLGNENMFIVRSDMRWLALIVGIVLCATSGFGGNTSAPRAPFRILSAYPMIQIDRNGSKSVWAIGIDISPSLSSKDFDPRLISIVEKKRSRELKDRMDFVLQDGGDAIICKFKPGKADLGTRNNVEIKLLPGFVLSNGSRTTSTAAINTSTSIPQ
jgi:hypothetical protein